MKIIDFLKKALLVSLTLMIVSCSNSEEPTPIANSVELTLNPTNIAGKWYEIGYTVNGVNLNSNIPTQFQGNCSTNKSYFEFSPSGSISRKQYNSTCIPSDYTGTFTIENSILTYSQLSNSSNTFYGHTGTLSGSQITSLTSTTLKTKYTQGSTIMEVTYSKM